MKLTIQINKKQDCLRFTNVQRFTTTICCIASLVVHGQKSSLLPHISYIPAKTFVSLSHEGADSISGYKSRNSSVKGFYISQSEVTNKEYREFVFYVRDSIAHTLLGHVTSDGHSLDWHQHIDWENKGLNPLMVPPDERAYGSNEIDPDKVKYKVFV